MEKGWESATEKEKGSDLVKAWGSKRRRRHNRQAVGALKIAVRSVNFPTAVRIRA